MHQLPLFPFDAPDPSQDAPDALTLLRNGSALAVIIFMIVGALTLVQFRLTRTWEEVSENV